jgi:hypothetical protein
VIFPPVLGLLDFERTFKVHIDALDKVIIGMSVQDGHLLHSRVKN